jgi:hypothetical protein
MAVFNPFLGTCDDNGIVGKNEWMHVYREER